MFGCYRPASMYLSSNSVLELIDIPQGPVSMTLKQDYRFLSPAYESGSEVVK